jgi:hypothetical protein
MMTYLHSTSVLALVANLGTLLWTVRAPLMRWMLCVLAGALTVVFMKVWPATVLNAMRDTDELRRALPYLYQAVSVGGFFCLGLSWTSSRVWAGIRQALIAPGR